MDQWPGKRRPMDLEPKNWLGVIEWLNWPPGLDPEPVLFAFNVKAR